ncbi:hypothetical protein HGRIS_000063 [Hohenbuehelia grisea]|uniref:Uncharacterized protein n=1 Tax=Hohenbuehelia grisea TaxID=104357 RepID=A0ABR3JQJ6_9AGAR
MQFKFIVAIVAAALSALPTAHSRPSSFDNQVAMQSSHGRLDLSGVSPNAFGIFSTQVCWRICAQEELRCPNGLEPKKFGPCWTCCRKEDLE